MQITSLTWDLLHGHFFYGGEILSPLTNELGKKRKKWSLSTKLEYERVVSIGRCVRNCTGYVIHHHYCVVCSRRRCADW